MSINIEVALNGYYVIIHVATPEGIAELNYIAQTLDEAFELIKGEI